MKSLERPQIFTCQATLFAVTIRGWKFAGTVMLVKSDDVGCVLALSLVGRASCVRGVESAGWKPPPWPLRATSGTS